MNDPGSGAASLPGTSNAVLPETLRRAFGFVDDDDNWFARLGKNAQPAPLGRLGRFELIHEIGRGGQGRVYRARQDSTGRDIAVKRLLAGALASPSSRARFEREIEAAAALDHPNIVALYGAEEVDGQPLLVMQWIDGVPFDVWARPPGEPARPTEEILGAFAGVCDAVHHAHQRGVIHRDLKPSNVLVDREGNPHVLDFGLAKLEREGQMTLTHSGDFLGTPAFAAPEQVGVGKGGIDVRTDVYALGVMLYQALVGRRPFEGCETLGALIVAMQHEPRPPSAHRRGLPRDLDAIVQTAISLEPERRYGSVEALCADVRRFLSGDVVLAHPPTVRYRVGKFLRRHAAISAVGALAASAVVALGVGSTVTAAREHALRVEATEARGEAEREATVQRDTADALLRIVMRISGHMANRRSIETRTLVPWLLEPLQEGNLNLRPDAQVKMHFSVFEVYMTMGNYKGAQEQLDESLPIVQLTNDLKDQFETEHAYNQFRVYSKRRMHTEQEASAREILRRAEQKHGTDSVQAGLPLTWLGFAVRAQGREDEGIEYVERAVAIFQEHDSIHIIDSRNWLVHAYFRKREFDIARALVQENLRFLEDRKSIASKYGAWTLENAGTIEFKLGEFEKAEAYFARLADYRIRTHGLKYNRTSTDLWWHAWALHAVGRLDEAIIRLEQSLVFTEQESRDMPTAAQKRFQVAIAMLASGRDEEGHRQILRAISKGKVLLPGDTEWDARADHVEAILREHQLRYDEHLGAKLGEFAWLMSKRTAAAMVSMPDEPPAAAPDGRPAADPIP